MSDQRLWASQIVGVPHPPAWEQAMKDLEDERAANKIAGVRRRLQELEVEYQHLPPLPPQLPSPLYVMQDVPGYRDDDASMSFYRSCAEGDLDRVRTFVDHSTPTPADLSFALEEACQNLQIHVVRFLLQQPAAQLYYRCFRRSIEFPDDDLLDPNNLAASRSRSRSRSQSIFISGSPSF